MQNLTIFGSGIERVAVRPITDNIHWITHCLGEAARDYYADYFGALPESERYDYHKNVDYPFSAFLIDGERPLLIDTVAPTQERNMLAALEHILGDRQLAYVWISHIELPHAGNGPAILKKYPEAKLITSDGDDHYFPLHGLNDALRVGPGDVIDLGRHKLEMIDAPFVDHGRSQWGYEQTTGTLISIDWGHNLHDADRGQCFQFLDEMFELTDYSEEVYFNDLKVNYWYQFPWLAFCDADEIAAGVEQIFAAREVKILAPSHGNVVRRDVSKYIPILRDAMRAAVEIPYKYS